MARQIPENLRQFLQNALKDVDDGYEYAAELHRILNSDDCQKVLSDREIETLRDYADRVRKIGEITYYSEERIRECEQEIFGQRGIAGYLGTEDAHKPQWPF